MSKDGMNNGTRTRGGWSKKKLAYLRQVQEVLEDLSEYHPLTLRQIYYQLVAAEIIENELSQYNKLSRTLTDARLDGKVSWAVMEDRSRSTLHSAGWEDADDFISDQLDGFLDGYRRDLLHTQDAALEVWIEKDALSRICHQVAFPYCVPVIVARGFSSISYVNDCRVRVLRNAEAGKRTVILYFGDLDPSGWEMLPAMMTTLQDEMELGDQVRGVRCALLPKQVEEYSLPHSVDAIKHGDTRAAKYIERFGELAVELDALPPATLEAVVRECIEANLDLSQFEDERKRQVNERQRVAGLRDQVLAMAADW